MAACIGHLDRWGVSRQYADGTLPAPGVYGVPEHWPHVRALYEQAGFVHLGHAEIVSMATVDELDYAGLGEQDQRALLAAGFRELTRTVRGRRWVREHSPTGGGHPG